MSVAAANGKRRVNPGLGLWFMPCYAADHPGLGGDAEDAEESSRGHREGGCSHAASYHGPDVRPGDIGVSRGDSLNPSEFL